MSTVCMSAAPVREARRVPRCRGEDDVAGPDEVGVDRALAQRGHVLVGVDRLAVQALATLRAVLLDEPAERRLVARVDHAAVARRGAPAQALGLEQHDARAELR